MTLWEMLKADTAMLLLDCIRTSPAVYAAPVCCSS